MRHLLLCLCLLIAPQAFSGGLEPSKDEKDAKIAPSIVKSSEVSARAEAEANVKTTDAVAKTVPDCRPPAGGNNVTNHGAVTNGGDSVNTKVVCSCESKPCKAKVVEKIVEKEVIRYVKSSPKIVEKVVERKVHVQGPTQVVEKPVEKVVYVDKPAPNDKNFTLGILVGSGPDGVHPYKYDKEYRAREGRGILMGLDVDYRFFERYHIGGLYINNDTYMGRLGISF